MSPFQFSVPMLPPSVNHYTRRRCGGGLFRTPAVKVFIDAVCVFSRKTRVTGNFYELDITFFLGPSKWNLNSNDLDNFQKVAIDALGHADVILNDSRILDLHLHKRFIDRDRDQRTDYYVTGRQIDDEREIFRERQLPNAAR